MVVDGFWPWQLFCSEGPHRGRIWGIEDKAEALVSYYSREHKNVFFVKGFRLREWLHGF